MLSHTHRFHGHNSVRVVFQKGISRRGRTMMLRALYNTKRTQPRVAVVVSKKVYKSAVKRNRIRRRIFEIVRHELLTVTLPIDVVITVFSPDCLVLAQADLELETRRLLQSLPTSPPVSPSS